MRAFVKDGTCKEFALWNVKDLGYLAYYTAALLVQGKIKGNPGEKFTASRLGDYTIDPNAVVLLGPPFAVKADNIDQLNLYRDAPRRVERLTAISRGTPWSESPS